MSVQTPASTAENTNNEGCLDNANDPPNAQEVTTLHDLAGTLIKLQVNNVGFRIPEPRISKFASLSILIRNGSFVEPINFSSKILVSAARVSAAYDYPALHAFCVKKLEGSSLGSIERLRIGRVLNLKSWEERACRELSERDTMITREEMLAVGVDAYFQVASAREKRQREQVAKLSSDSAHCMDSDRKDKADAGKSWDYHWL
ncbi:unnamed protein product [Rhizoctonia solani]|uniref:Uncharacterized protein n=1 Tax=Rhizoctonia solani TaxID=456999 RepID=A0A8H3HFS4_9AGAM|nr:unnamed protein product [Rhizoctonia solani]